MNLVHLYFSTIFVGDFHQLTQVGDRHIYEEGGDYYMLLDSIENFMQIKIQI